MGRAPCCDKNGLKRGPWTPEEDQKLIDYIQKHGHGSWRTLPKNAGLSRCGKSCRLRWTNYLRPDIKRGRFSFEEEETIIQLHSILGNKWSAIAARLPGRTDNEIKNYWNTHIRKRLLRMGIDPVTHSPRLDLLDISSILSSSLYNPAQLSLTKLLGMEPFFNSEALRLATSILSSQHESQMFLPQDLQENQFSNSQGQHPLPYFQTQQLQTPIQDIPSCPTSNGQFRTGAHLMPITKEQFPSDFSDLSYQNTQSTLWKDNLMPSNLDQRFTTLENCDCYNSNQSSMNPLSGHLNYQPNSSNFNFSSVLSAPASSPVTLNVSSTYINSSTSPTPLNSSSTCLNNSTEDERDSYCSNLLKFEIPQLPDVNEFM
ncbi:hypothetical protein AAC387_Pa04g1572 [Persea americana]